MDILKPIYGEVWAASGEKLAPENTKIDSGWILEMMPYQYENFLQNRQDVAITYLMQKGVAEWSDEQEYTANKSVVQYQGHLYIATSTVTNILPTVTASWRKLTVTVGTNGAIPISAGGTGATTAEQARINLGVGSASGVDLPASDGMLVKLASGLLASRTITGTPGLVEIANGDGQAGDPTISVGVNVAKTNADASWTTTGSIRLPTGTTAQRGVAAAGRIRFNLDSSVFEGYDGTSWNPVGSTGVFDVKNFSGDGVKTEFVLSSTPRSENNTQVYINGIYQQKNTYTLTNETLTFSVAPISGVDNIEVVTATSITIGTTTAGQTSITDSGNYYNSGNVEGALQEVVTQQMLAASSGSSLVGYDGGTSQDVLDDAKPMANYTALRAYTGRATGVRITARPIAGFFQRDGSDTTSADNGGTIIVDALGRRWKRLFDLVIDARWFEIAGDGSDESSLLSKAFASANGKTLDFAGMEVSFSTQISISITLSSKLQNGLLRYIGGTQLEFAVRIDISTLFETENFVVDANNKAAKAKWIRAIGNDAEFKSSRGSGGINCLSVASNGMAAGAYIYPQVGFTFKSVIMDNPLARDIDSVGAALVGRGIIVQDSKYTEINSPDIRRVGPYQDGEGIFAFAPNVPSSVLIINGGYYEDCQKRAVKSQIANSTIQNPTVRRTQFFANGPGQCEIDLQSGGASSGLRCFYSSGAVPRSLVGGGNSGRGVRHSDIAVFAENPDDVINSLFVVGNYTNDAQSGYIFSDVALNCDVGYVVSAYSADGPNDANIITMDGVEAKNIRGRNLLSGLVFVSRGGTRYVSTRVSVSDVDFQNETLVPVSVLDPAPGSTSYLKFVAGDWRNVRGVLYRSASFPVDSSPLMQSKFVNAAENATGSISFSLAQNHATKIFCYYSSTRDAGAKLYFEGIVIGGQATATYVETLTGVKSSAQQGAISLAVSGNIVTVSKTAGSLTTSGRLGLLLMSERGIA